jgi:hypothetical protein
MRGRVFGAVGAGGLLPNPVGVHAFAGFLVEAFGRKGTLHSGGIAPQLANPLLAPMFRALRSDKPVPGLEAATICLFMASRIAASRIANGGLVGPEAASRAPTNRHIHGSRWRIDLLPWRFLERGVDGLRGGWERSLHGRGSRQRRSALLRGARARRPDPVHPRDGRHDSPFTSRHVPTYADTKEILSHARRRKGTSDAGH